MSEPGGREVAVFLDWENIKISLEEVGRSPDPGLLRRAVEQFGRMSVAKAYSDWSAESYRRDMETLYTSGIEPVYAPSKMPSGDEGQMRWHHNSVDIKLAVDCTLVAATRPDIGTFVLVTGDADFIHVVNALRWQGRRVVVIGTSWNAARRLVENADVFVAYDGGVDRGLTSALLAVNRAQQRPPQRHTPIAVPIPVPVPAAHTHQPARMVDPEEAFTALGALVRALPDGIRLSRLKGMLRERLGRFDERRIGYSRFERFAREAERRGYVRIEPGPDEPMAYPPGSRVLAEVAQRPSENGAQAEVKAEPKAEAPADARVEAQAHAEPESAAPESAITLPSPAAATGQHRRSRGTSVAAQAATPLLKAAAQELNKTEALADANTDAQAGDPAEAPSAEAEAAATAGTSAEGASARRTAARGTTRRSGRRRTSRANGDEPADSGTGTSGTSGEGSEVAVPTPPTATP